MFQSPKFVVALTLEQYISYQLLCFIAGAVLLAVLGIIMYWEITFPIIGTGLVIALVLYLLARPRRRSSRRLGRPNHRAWAQPRQTWPTVETPRPANDRTFWGEVIPPDRPAPPANAIVTRTGRIITIDPEDRWLVSR